jgi:hypothetical protein
MKPGFRLMCDANAGKQVSERDLWTGPSHERLSPRVDALRARPRAQESLT